ncbi:hypothetical protein Tco_0584415, partial [Tanacetum coccineum]
ASQILYQGPTLESKLKETKQTYNDALTKLIKRVKKLEQTIKTSQARRRAKVVISDDEEAEEDPSNQGRSLIEELDLDDGISLVPPHAADQGRFDETQISDQPEEQRRREVSTGSGGVSTTSRLVITADISTANKLDSIAGVKAKDKGKVIMHELKPPKKINKRVQVQMSVDKELAKKSDPAILRYHTLQNKPFSVAEVRKNMCLYLKNQGSEIEKEVMKRSEFDLQQESSKPIKEEIVQQDDVIAEQAKLEDDNEKEELQVFLNIIPEEESLDVESLAIKYPIVDWETHILANDKSYYQIKRADGSERFQTTSPEGYDLLLRGDLKTLIEPNKEDEVWRNQQDWNLINWKLHNFCRVYVLLMDTGFVIHMMVEKKYPLSHDTLSKMSSRKLEVDHQSDMGYELIRFVKS